LEGTDFTYPESLGVNTEEGQKIMISALFEVLNKNAWAKYFHELNNKYHIISGNTLTTKVDFLKALLGTMTIYKLQDFVVSSI